MVMMSSCPVLCHIGAIVTSHTYIHTHHIVTYQIIGHQ